MPIQLPTTKSEVDSRFSSQKIAMLGQPKIGKSEFFSAGKVLFLQTEAGLNHLRCMKVPIQSWEVFREAVGALINASQKKEEFPYEMVLIDTIDRLVDLGNEEVVEKQRQFFKSVEINHISDIPNGKGWSLAQQLIENALTKLEELPCAVGFIGHLDIKEVKLPTSVVHKQTISIGGKMGGMLLAWADHILNIQATFRGTELIRTVRTIPNQAMEAGSRGMMVPDGWVWAQSAEENWKKFRGFFK